MKFVSGPGYDLTTRTRKHAVTAGTLRKMHETRQSSNQHHVEGTVHTGSRFRNRNPDQQRNSPCYGPLAAVVAYCTDGALETGNAASRIKLEPFAAISHQMAVAPTRRQVTKTKTTKLSYFEHPHPTDNAFARLIQTTV